MKRTVTINYNWTQADGSEVLPHHVEYLEESAMERINSQVKEGFTSGELHDNLNTVDDPENFDGIDYHGYWSVSTTLE